MTAHPFSGRAVLVVEDDYLISTEMSAALTDSGVVVVGPAGNVGDALALIERTDPLDGAMLDVNLRGEWSFPVADRLVERGVPFVFLTGYDGTVIPDRFHGIRRCEKPLAPSAALRALAG